MFAARKTIMCNVPSLNKVDLLILFFLLSIWHWVAYNWQEHIKKFFLLIKLTRLWLQSLFIYTYLIFLKKDTANPVSHHVMASLNCFNSTQALAPSDKRIKEDYFTLIGTLTCSRPFMFLWARFDGSVVWIAQMIRNPIPDRVKQYFLAKKFRKTLLLFRWISWDFGYWLIRQ